MTTRGTQTITWDVENRPLTVTGGASFIYDGDGNRVKKTEGGQTILYVNKYYEKNLTTGDVTTYYYHGDKLVAKRTGTTLQYIHQDHLTGSSVVSASNGALVNSILYAPYGSTRSGDVPADRKFTGQRLDGTGLYFYGARYYDPNIGRFISPDTIVPNPANPQSLNRYSYVLNNPLKYIDPTGYDYWVADEGLNDNGEYWYCVYSDSDYTVLVGIVTGGSELEARFGQEPLHLNNDERAMELQRGTAAYQIALNRSELSLIPTEDEFYGGVDFGITLDNSSIKLPTGIWASPWIMAAGAAVPLFFELSSEYGGGGIVRQTERALIQGTGGRIAGFANDAGDRVPHGMKQILGREGAGVSNEAIIEAVNSLNTTPQKNGNTLFTGANARVVLDPSGRLVTAWAGNIAGWR
jgi:RHS repeat-associated protein